MFEGKNLRNLEKKARENVLFLKDREPEQRWCNEFYSYAFEYPAYYFVIISSMKNSFFSYLITFQVKVTTFPFKKCK